MSKRQIAIKFKTLPMIRRYIRRLAATPHTVSSAFDSAETKACFGLAWRWLDRQRRRRKKKFWLDKLSGALCTGAKPTFRGADNSRATLLTVDSGKNGVLDSHALFTLFRETVKPFVALEDSLMLVQCVGVKAPLGMDYQRPERGRSSRAEATRSFRGQGKRK